MKALALVGSIITWLHRPFRIVRVQGVLSSVYWTVRSWIWNYPITPDFGLWDEGEGPTNKPAWTIHRKRIRHTWQFLHPFFASKGYSCYVPKDPKDPFSRLIPSTKRIETVETMFPFAQYCCQSDDQVDFLLISPVVWPARNKNGQDVMIKAISAANATNELKAFRLLHSDALRDDPRNHTIPILEYIQFEEQIFSVMPRWSKAYYGDFVNVAELLRYGRAFFEAVAFLHEHNIAHGDILLQNMFMDVLVPSRTAIVPFPNHSPLLAGLRGPERKYVFIDFETATLPPVDGSPSSTELEKAFKHDVRRLATELELNLRCIEDVIPPIGPLFDSMKDIDSPNQPTAASALARFEEICMALKLEDYERTVDTVRWHRGELRRREGPPVYWVSSTDV